MVPEVVHTQDRPGTRLTRRRSKNQSSPPRLWSETKSQVSTKPTTTRTMIHTSSHTKGDSDPLKDDPVTHPWTSLSWPRPSSDSPQLIQCPDEVLGLDSDSRRQDRGLRLYSHGGPPKNPFVLTVTWFRLTPISVQCPDKVLTNTLVPTVRTNNLVSTHTQVRTRTHPYLRESDVNSPRPRLNG